MEVTQSPRVRLGEKTNILILICAKCGWSLRAPRNCLEINENGFLCGRCFEKIVFSDSDKDSNNLID